jgi:SAM-dependent methyltransferase
MAKGDQHRLFLDTSSTAALSDWDDLLRLQVELFAPRELEFLGAFLPWRKAADILDVGCGNGLYTAALRSGFPKKSYMGIDLSEGLIERARLCDREMSYEVADLFDFTPNRQFDLVIMRFLVQHLSDFAAVLDRCSRLLRPLGGLLIVEPDLGLSWNDPPTPLFQDLLRKFERSREDDGRMRARIADPAGLLSGAEDWALAGDRIVRIPHPAFVAFALYCRWIDVFERSGLLAVDFEKTRLELQNWAATPGATTEIALRVIYLDRPT